MHEKVLIVDDERLIRWTLSEAVRGWGYTPVEADTVAAALALFDAESPAVVLLDINLPDGSGLDALREIIARQPQSVVVMITANVLVDDTISALRGGAYDFVGKPINLDELEVAIRNGLEARRLRKEVARVRGERSRRFGFDQIVGDSPAIRETVALARKVAESEVSAVLLQGESGTGKDLIAKAIHYASARAERPFVAINCAAIPTGLLESELFGHERGAFTGAIAQRIGRFELAHRGTLLLDEVGDIPLDLQPKLLRVLQEHEFERLGSSRTIRVDARLIAATNADLPEMVAEKRFRSDLFYRLNVFPIAVPPLRERVEDVPLLTAYFAQMHGRRMRKEIRSVPRETVEAMCEYAWPGNVRELENFVERAVILTRGEELQAPLGELRRGATVPVAAAAAVGKTAPATLEQAERAHIEEVLRRTNGVVGGRGGAAEILGLPISTLRGRMKKLGLL